MLFTLTTKYSRQTQNALFLMALVGLFTGTLFEGVPFHIMLSRIGGALLVAPIVFGMMWLVLMVQLWVQIAPRVFLRFMANAFFLFSVFASGVAIIVPIFVKDLERPGSSVIMTFVSIASALAAFYVYKKHLVISANAA